MSNKEIIEEIITKTFGVIQNAYDSQKESSITPLYESFIVFPQKADDDDGNDRPDRISEQELRFIFVEQFNKLEATKKKQLFYSVETPTKSFYYFSGEDGPKCIPKGEHDDHKGEKGAGRSGNIDLVIFQKNDENINRVALIEFKAHNPDKNDYRKDICKLINEEANNGCLKYFIQIINVKNQKRTLENITDKIKDVDALKEQGKNIDYCINYRCFNLYSKVVHKFITGTIRNNKFEYTECELPSTAESTR